ncbi:putative nucleotidyltransferase substrate binding domain-containing protein [Fundidesulfovibrio putealis]|uniref:putative nucleotidyltransferase substrate binding domain-containing protein n=1 Tax=Fundidesulfovibrio putealis TaxID=270496 RepID=UPI0004142CE2|nr:putative nucleotidyltransferase substrate binding domain-containing protein [Fundidesulfovibrio putealis]
MNDSEGFLGLTTGSLTLKAPVFVTGETSVVEAARAMRAARATACLVGSAQAVAGILTERDISWAVADGRDLTGPASQFMTRGVVTIGREDLVAEAFLAMIRHGIRRLAVTDETGLVTAMLDERDLMAARLESPVALSAAISRAGDGPALARAYAGLSEILPLWLRQGADVSRAGALAAAVRDQLFCRAAELALAGGADPGPLALVVLGSEGRREQFLATDQDNALVLGEGTDTALAEGFAARLMDILNQAGLPPCPHGVTADHAAWRMTTSAWNDHLEALGRDLGPDAVLALSLLADARHVFGDPALTGRLRASLLQTMRDNPRALRYMAREAVRFEPPLSVFGALVTEKNGPGRGGLDLKRGGVFPLTQGARVLALDQGVAATAGASRLDTASRLEGAAEAGVITDDTASDLAQALAFMQELRLRFQARALAEGREPDSFIYPDRMSRLERSRLKECFKAVAAFQAILTNKYALRLLT